MDWLGGDFYFYFTFADNFFHGLIPYRDYFLDQFPGAFLVYLFPRFFASNSTSYILLFSLLMAAIFFLQVLILVRKWRETKKEKVWLIFLILSSALILPLAIIRFDLVPTIFTFLAILLLQKRTLIPWFLMALGTVTKIFPLTLFPLLLIRFWQTEDKRKTLRGILIYLLTVVAIFVPFILLGGEGGISFVFNYHFSRPIQIESLPASILFLGFLLGGSAETFNSFFSWNLTVAGWDKAVSQLFFILWPASIALIYFWFWQQTKRGSYTKEQEFLLVKASLMTILVFIGFNKVFSPQYLIWPFPFVFWFLLYLPRKRMIVLGTLWCLIVFFTMLNLFQYWDLVSLKPSAILSQILRNILVLVFLGGVLITRIEETRFFKREVKQ